MKATSITNNAVFTFDNLPIPVIIYKVKDGRLLKFNKEAQQVFNIPAKARKPFFINQIRPVALPVFPVGRSKAVIHYGSIAHTTIKGKNLTLIVLRKKMTWKGVRCFIDFLEKTNKPVSAIKQITATPLDALVSSREKQVVPPWNKSEESISDLEKQKAEGSLRKSLERYATLANNIPDAMIYEYWVNADGTDHKFTYVSEGVTNMFELTADAVIKNVAVAFAMVHPDDAPAMMKAAQTARKNLMPFNMEYRIKVASGKLKWVKTKSRPRRLADGSTVFDGVSMDITEYKRVKLALEKSENDLRAMLDASTDATFFLGTDQTIRIFNKTAEESVLKLFNKQIHTGDKMELFVPPVFVHEFKSNFARTLKGEKIQIEREIHVGDIPPFWLSVRYLPVYDAHQKIIGVSLRRVNITERKEAELALEKSENYLRAMIDASIDSTFLIDNKGKIVLANKKAKETVKALLGTVTETGIPFSSLVIDKNAQAEIEDNINKALTGEIIEYDRQMKLPGQDTWFQIRYLPVYINGKVIGVSHYSIDITNRKLAELALSQSEVRFKNLYNHSPVMMHSIDYGGKIVRVNNYWLHQMGYTEEQVVGRHIVEFLTNNSKQKALEHYFPAYLKTGLMDNVELQFETAGGKILDTLLSATTEYDHQGRFLRSLTVVTDITEKKKLEKEVERLSRIASHTSNMVVFTDVDGNITWVNDGFEKITEYTRDEVLGKKPGSFLQGPETNPATIKIMRKAIRKGEGFKTELLNYSKSGGKYWIDVEVMPVLDDGILTGFMAIETDITLLKKTVYEWLNSQAQLVSMLNSAPVAAAMKDLEGKYFFFNEGFERLVTNIVLKPGLTDYDIFEKEDADLYRQKDLAVIAKALPISYELRFGDRFYYSTKFPVRNHQGNIYAVGVVSIDITEQKSAEEQFRSLVRDINVGIMLQGSKSEILLSNQAALDLLGLTEEQLLGRSSLSPEWRVMHEDGTDFPGPMHPVPQAIQTKKPVRNVVMAVFRPTTQSYVWLLVDAIPRLNEHDQLINVIVTFSDISKQKHYEQNLLDSLREKEMLIKEIHHRVKNSLQIISSILFVRKAITTQPDTKNFLEETRQKIHGIALVHERLLQTESLSQIDIVEYLNKLLLDLQITLVVPGKKISFTSSVVSATLNLDTAINCGLILNELVINAVKHAFEDGKEGTIRIAFGKKENTFEITVEDDGIGLPENVQPGFGGFGMMLLDIFIKQLKARIEIKRKPGTKFSIWFNADMVP